MTRFHFEQMNDPAVIVAEDGRRWTRRGQAPEPRLVGRLMADPGTRVLHQGPADDVLREVSQTERATVWSVAEPFVHGPRPNDAQGQEGWAAVIYRDLNRSRLVLLRQSC